MTGYYSGLKLQTGRRSQNLQLLNVNVLFLKRFYLPYLVLETESHIVAQAGLLPQPISLGIGAAHHHSQLITSNT